MYKIISIYGKPYEEKVNNDEELILSLSNIYYEFKEDEEIDFMVLDYKDEDITESQFCQEIMAKIIDEATQ